MGYYVRVFCASAEVPELAAIQTWLRDRGSKALLDDPDHALHAAKIRRWSPPTLDLSAPFRGEIAIVFRPGRHPILAECNRDDDPEDPFLKEEIAEFIELIEPVESPNKERVLAHLASTHFIVACQFPPRMDDVGYNANGEFLTYFVERCGGLIQADGEGFYEGHELILPLP
jgi:hypothetical protein